MAGAVRAERHVVAVDEVDHVRDGGPATAVALGDPARGADRRPYRVEGPAVVARFAVSLDLGERVHAAPRRRSKPFMGTTVVICESREVIRSPSLSTRSGPLASVAGRLLVMTSGRHSLYR